jgi:hypothetical protein
MDKESERWSNELAREFVNEMRLIADRWKKGEIKDWGRLRTIITNLTYGNFQQYLFDMNRISIKEAEDAQYKRYADNLKKTISDQENEIAALKFQIKKLTKGIQ